MAQWCWATFFIFPLLVQAQSGSGDDEPSVTCESSMTIDETSLTCSMDEDLYADLKNATLCTNTDMSSILSPVMSTKRRITFRYLSPFHKYDLNIEFETRGQFTGRYDLRKIIRPNPPQVNATFIARDWKALVSIKTGYENDYLKQALQFHISIKSGNKNSANYVVSQNELYIESRELLRENTEFCVTAQSKPVGKYFDGFWSQSSPCSWFHTPNATVSSHSDHPKYYLYVYLVMGALLVVLMIVAVVVQRWYKKIKSVIWPIIPNPKNTLVQSCKPNKGPPASFNPEAFTDNSIHMIDRVEERFVSPNIPDTMSNYEVRGHSSGQRSTGPILRSCSSSIGETQPMLQSKARAEEEGHGSGKQMSASATTRNSGTSVRSEANNTENNVPVPRRDEAYVTMSSFYKTQ